MHSVPVIMCFKTHVSILYFRHPFDYQIIYLINTSSASNSTSVDKLIHHKNYHGVYSFYDPCVIGAPNEFFMGVWQ